MRALVRQIALLAVGLLLICAINRLAAGNAYTAYVPATGGESIRVAPDDAGRLSVGEMKAAGDYSRIRLSPRSTGQTGFRVYSGGRVETRELRVGPFMTVYDVSTGGFTGDTTVLVATTLFFLAVSVIMMRYYVHVRVPAFYAYASIYAAGFSLFMLLTGATMAYVTIRHLTRPAAFSMLSAYEVISRAGFTFMLSSSPLIVFFAVAMTVSNIALMRHEKPRFKNALGMLAGMLLLTGEIAAIIVSRSGLNHPDADENIQQLVLFVLPTIFVYFECMLLGAILCGLRAANHEPPMDRDCLIILGCWFRKDGTLTPLLRGRADRALDFWKRQREATGREALFMPSGGQGDDEPMPEAEAIARYLREQGVPEQLIRPETRSKNTYQNMAYSKALLNAIAPGAKPAFVTTNYHVFRSGVWANLAGFPIEGFGSDTKWWYWPNAFMRECAGLLVNRWRQEILLLIVMILFFGTLAALL